MTKTQRAALTPADVVGAAMRLLAEEGLDAVTVRAVADRLGVQMNTVLWHVKTKKRLLELMADAVVGTIDHTGLPDAADERAAELIRRYRGALLAHRDGAALVTGTHVPEPHTLRFGEALLAALRASHDDPVAATRIFYALVYFTLGLAQEQQTTGDADQDRLARAADPEAHPALIASLHALAADTFDDRFEDGIRRLLGKNADPD